MKFSHSHHAPFLVLKALDDYFFSSRKKHSRPASGSLQKAVKNIILRLGKTIYSLPESIADAYRRRAAMRELYALDDRALQDIGLTRGQVRALAAGMISLEALEAEREQARSRNRISHALSINDGLRQATSAFIEQRAAADKQHRYCCDPAA